MRTRSRRSRRTARHLVELVNSILDLSKIEAGRLECGAKIPVDPWDLLEETYRLMRAPAKAKGLKLEMAGLNEIPGRRSRRTRRGCARS